MKRNLLKCILWALVLAGCFPLFSVAGAQQKEQRYKIAVCDWMILKRQKIGSFQLVHELKGDGVELDMGGLGKRERLYPTMQERQDSRFHYKIRSRMERIEL